MRKKIWLLLFGAITCHFACAAIPENSTIATREVLSYTTVNGAKVRSVNVGAPDAFLISNHYIYSPVWYQWTTVSTGTANIDVAATFDSVVSVYISTVDDPTSVDDLILVGYDDDSGDGLNSSLVNTDPGANVTYYIAVSGFAGAQGEFLLLAQQDIAELPDDFADALALSGNSFNLRGRNVTATTEVGEPKHAKVSNQTSTWVKWTVDQRSTVTLDTIGSTFDTVLAVYTGSSLSTLTAIKSSDDISTGFNPVTQSKVSFSADPGVTYYFAVAGKNGAVGTVYLNLSATPRPPDFTPEATKVYAQDGTTASIHAAAEGTGTLTYQWQHKPFGQTVWTNLSNDSTYGGVTTTTLSISNVSLDAMNGDQFRSVATDDVGTSYSKATTLVITEFAPLAVTVGGTASIDLSLTTNPPPPVGATYYTSGLPAGFVLDATTGLITVSSTITPKPGSYPVSYGTTTTDINGKKINSAPTVVLIVVSPLSTDLSGGFETILEDTTTDLPVGKVALLINAKTGIITGKLTTSTDAKTYALKGKLSLNSSYDVGTASIVVTRDKTSLPYRLDLTLDGTTPGSPVLSASLKQLDASLNVTATLSDSTSGVQLTTYTTLSPAPWQGKYTLVLDDPTTPPVNQGVTTPPEGTGYGTVTILANKGLMSFKGKLGDGTALTASLAPSSDGSYRWYVKPYKTGGSFGGWIQFVPVSGGVAPYQVTGTSDSELYWTKSAFATDKSYRAGFGPIAITATAQLWTAPASGTPLNTSLKLTNGALSSSFTSASLPGADTSLLPTTLRLGSDNKITVTLPSANADKFAAKVNTSTGGFTASLTLSDLRKVTVEGVFLQQPGTVATGTVIGEGFFTIPPLIKGNENVTGKVLFVAP